MMSQSQRNPLSLSQKRFPDDLVFDILALLPVKSLIRFRCFSKYWNSTITSRIFITTHSNNNNQAKNNNNNHNGFLFHLSSDRKDLCTSVYSSDRTLTEVSRLRIPYSDAGLITVADYCNGLFLLRNLLDRTAIYLLNSSIQKIKRIATTPTPTTGLCSYYDFTYGLAYHSQNDDFKIVRILRKKMPLAEVYTLSTDSWKRVEILVESDSESNIQPVVDVVPNDRCLFFNGALHVVAFTEGRLFILSFDVNEEKFRMIKPPQGIILPYRHNASASYKLAVFEGSLALINSVQDMRQWHIWVMREYGVIESWIKRTVESGLFESWTGWFLGVTVNGEILFNKSDGRLLISYNPESRNMNYLGIVSPALFYTADLKESLVLLD